MSTLSRHGCMSAAAGLARAMSAAVMSPVTLVKTRMEYGGPNHITYKNTAHALVTIASSEGPRGLFRGLWPTVLTNAPFSALYYMLYTKLKGTLSDSLFGGSLPPTAVNFVTGVCAATAATLLTQPTDVVRTRMQLGIPGAARGGAFDTLGHVLRGGPNALLAGEQHTAQLCRQGLLPFNTSHRANAVALHMRCHCQAFFLPPYVVIRPPRGSPSCTVQ